MLHHTCIASLVIYRFFENIFRSGKYWQGYVGDKHRNTNRSLCGVLYFILFIALRLRVGRFKVRILARKRNFLFPRTPRLALRPIQPPVQCVMGFFPGGKATGAWS
jgi:hypothetical protein